MPKVEFISAPAQHELAPGTHYEVGGIYEMREDQLQRWERRGRIRRVGDDAKLTAVAVDPSGSSPVPIPDGWDTLPWPELRALAASVSATPVRNKEDARAAIVGELANRTTVLVPVQMADDGQLPIEGDWPQLVMAPKDLLANPPAHVAVRDDGSIEVQLGDQTARYRLVDEADDGATQIQLKLVDIIGADAGA